LHAEQYSTIAAGSIVYHIVALNTKNDSKNLHAGMAMLHQDDDHHHKDKRRNKAQRIILIGT